MKHADPGQEDVYLLGNLLLDCLIGNRQRGLAVAEAKTGNFARISNAEIEALRLVKQQMDATGQWTNGAVYFFVQDISQWL